MHIQYLPSMSVLLSVHITVSACQSNTHRMYMGDSDGDHSATDQSHKEHDASAMPLEVITDELTGMHFKEASVDTSSATPSPSSSGDGGSPMSVQITSVPEHKEPEDAKPIAVTANEATDAQVAPEYSPDDHETWFHEFVNAVDNPEAWTWNDIEAVLDKGKPLGYLTQPIAWDDDEYTPLHYAAQEGDLEIVKALVDQKVSVNITTNDCQRTPLHLAAQEGHLEMVKCLIEQCNAKWNQEDKDGSNVLHYAASGTEGDANVEVVKYLIEVQGADLCAEVAGFNVLYLAIKVNNPELVRYLVTEYPILTTSKDEGSVSPLAFAKATGRITIVGIIEEVVKNISCF